MMNWKMGVAALTFAALAASPALAAGHDSNTGHKLGKSIEYPFRKFGHHASVVTHRTTGHNSVEHRRNGNKTYRSVVTPNGRIHRKHRVH